jgi:hypothetical protein
MASEVAAIGETYLAMQADGWQSSLCGHGYWLERGLWYGADVFKRCYGSPVTAWNRGGIGEVGSVVVVVELALVHAMCNSSR